MIFVEQNGQTQNLLDKKHKVQIQPKSGFRTFCLEDLCARARWLSRVVTHTCERGAGRQAGVHADELARKARTHAGGQAGGQTPADPLLNTGTLEDIHTANPRPRWIVPG